MSKTSFFNPTIFKRNTKGYWPVWALYLFVLLIILPVSAQSAVWSGLSSADEIGRHFLTAGKTASYFTGILFAPVGAMSVFSFMFNTRSAGWAGALPVKRETLFFTNVITLIIWAAGVHLITGIFTVIVNIRNMGMLVIIAEWALIGFLNTLFFIGLAVLCALLTSNMFILPVVYFVLNFLVIGVFSFISFSLEELLYGYSSTTLPAWVTWFSPAYELLRTMDENRIAAANIIYAAVGIILILIALILIRKHKMETASDVVAVKALKPVARYLAAFGGALIIGTFLKEILFYNHAGILGYVISFSVGAFIGYFAAEMLIRKSFRVFNKWPGFVAVIIVISVFFICVGTDVFGFESFIPDESAIESAKLEINGNEGTANTAEAVNAVREAHRELAEKRQYFNGEEAETVWFKVQYKLTDGRSISRAYDAVISKACIDKVRETTGIR